MTTSAAVATPPAPATDRPLLELRGVSKLRLGAGAHRCRLRGEGRRSDGARRGQRRRQVDADQVRRRHPHGATGGQIFFDGEPVSIHGPKDSAKLGIEVDVPGSRALRQPRRRPEHVPGPRGARLLSSGSRSPRWRSGTAETMKSLAVTTIRSIRQPVATLSGGQRQSVAVARAVMWNSRLVILDEPTAALGVAQADRAGARARCAPGPAGSRGGVHLHNLHDVFAVAHRITVLRLGRNIARLRA